MESQKLDFGLVPNEEHGEFDRVIFVEIKEKMKQRQAKDRRKVLRMKRITETAQVEKVVAENAEALNFFETKGDNIYDGVSSLFGEKLEEPEEMFKIYQEGDWVGSFSVIEKNVLITSNHIFDGQQVVHCALGAPDGDAVMSLIQHDSTFKYAIYTYRGGATRMPPILPLRGYRDGMMVEFTKKGYKIERLVTSAVPGTSFAVCRYNGTGPGWSGYPLTDGYNTSGVFDSISGRNVLFAVPPSSHLVRAIANGLNDRAIVPIKAFQPLGEPACDPMSFESFHGVFKHLDQQANPDTYEQRVDVAIQSVSINEKVLSDQIKVADKERELAFLEKEIEEVNSSLAQMWAVNNAERKSTDKLRVSGFFCDYTDDCPACHFNGDWDGRHTKCSYSSTVTQAGGKGKTKKGRGRLFKWHKSNNGLSSEEYEEILQLFYDLNGRMPDEKEMNDAINDRLQAQEDAQAYVAEQDDPDREQAEMDALERVWAKYDRIQAQIDAYLYGGDGGDGQTIERLSASEKEMLGLPAGKKKRDVSILSAVVEERGEEEEEPSEEEETEEALLAKLEAIRLKKKATTQDPQGEIARKYSEMKKNLSNQAYEAECNALQERIRDFQKRGVVVNRTIVLNDLEKKKFPPNEHFKQTLLKTLRALKDLEVVQKESEARRKRAQAVIISNQDKINQKEKELEDLRNALLAAEEVIKDANETLSQVSKDELDRIKASEKSRQDF